jgi:hypothetical protein
VIDWRCGGFGLCKPVGGWLHRSWYVCRRSAQKRSRIAEHELGKLFTAIRYRHLRQKACSLEALHGEIGFPCSLCQRCLRFRLCPAV